jgi:hypothetical protein
MALSEILKNAFTTITRLGLLRVEFFEHILA